MIIRKNKAKNNKKYKLVLIPKSIQRNTNVEHWTEDDFLVKNHLQVKTEICKIASEYTETGLYDLYSYNIRGIIYYNEHDIIAKKYDICNGHKSSFISVYIDFIFKKYLD